MISFAYIHTYTTIAASSSHANHTDSKAKDAKRMGQIRCKKGHLNSLRTLERKRSRKKGNNNKTDK